jgi:1,4-dihydroxy-2-naphthoate polyprenyltransferase
MPLAPVSTSPPAPTLWRAWSAALRPASLPIAVSPVLVGAAVAFHQQGQLPPLLTLTALLCALLMQLITNLQNDVGYTQRGGERLGNRTGLPRATAEGWLTPRAVRRAIVVLSLLALGLGLLLCYWRGWPVLALGTASLLAALAYMGGPRPIAYTPWGELTVFVFFGLVAVLGTEWLLSGQTSVLGALAAVAVGSLSAAALLVNNRRDMAHDRSVGRATLAVWLGERRCNHAMALLLGLPFAASVVMALWAQQLWLLLPCLLLHRAWQTWRRFATCAPGLAFNPVLFAVFRLVLGFAAALAAGLILSNNSYNI